MNTAANRFTRIGWMLTLVVSASPWLQSQEIDSAAKEAELIKILQTGAPAEKAIACKQLTIYGSEKAVPELARLLSDEQLASWARIPLEAIPGEAADAALRKSLASLEGRLLVGAINSVGVRRDAASVAALANHLQHEDADVVLACAMALGRIGNAAAAEALQPLLADQSPQFRAAAAEGCILCAEKFLADGKPVDATALYDKVRQASVPKLRKLEATRGSIVARGREGIPLLVDQLRSPDKQFLEIGLSVARELPGTEVDEAVAGELKRADPDRAALLMYALADRELANVPAGVVAVAAKGEEKVRIAAIELVGRRGNASHVDALVSIASESDEKIASAAIAALVNLPGEGVDAEILATLTKSDSKELPIVIGLIGERRIDATATLKKALNDSQKSVRTAALAALGETVGPDDLPVLISQVVEPPHDDQAEEAYQALKAAAVRMPDRDICAATITDAMGDAPTATKVKLLEILGSVQGKKSLATIAQATKSSSDELVDAGTRLLGNWMSVEAAPVLFDVAKTSKSNKYKVRSLRGYIRFPRQFPMPTRDRVDMAKNALQVAIRPEERKLVLEVLERYPSGDTLRLAVEAADDPAVRQDANRVAAALAEKLGGPSATVEDMLAKAGREPVKVEILKAVYGSSNQQKDVTELLQQQVGYSPIVGLPEATYNATFGDPAPGAKKVLRVEYRIADKPGSVSFEENAPLILPIPN